MAASLQDGATILVSWHPCTCVLPPVLRRADLGDEYDTAGVMRCLPRLCFKKYCSFFLAHSWVTGSGGASCHTVRHSISPLGQGWDEGE